VEEQGLSGVSRRGPVGYVAEETVTEPAKPTLGALKVAVDGMQGEWRRWDASV